MLIGFLGGFTTAGQYKIIEQIIMPIRTYLQMIFRFFYPKLCYEIYNDSSKGIQYWKKINAANLMVIVFLLGVIFIFSHQVLTFFKVEKTHLDSVSQILKYALLIPLFITFSFTFEQLLFSIEKKGIYIKVTIFTVLINFVLMYFLFKKYQLYGLVTSLLVTESLVILSYIFILKSFFNQIKTQDARNTV